jgi:hypothetical protein
VWFYFVGGIAALFVVAIVVVVATLRGRKDADVTALQTPVAQASATNATISPPAAPSSMGSAMVSGAMHGPGQESAELRSLIEEQLRLVASCRSDASRCVGWTRYSQVALTTPIDAGSFSAARSEGPLAGWLQRLKLPQDFPVDDNSTLRQIFEYDSKNIRGRAEFQQKYFNCAAFEDIFDSTLLKYGAPAWLKAVVYQESGCVVTATSGVGAKGLWQFMPESARSYGLRVSEGEIDERLDPVKATDAAIHFFTDLHHDLGAWDLALAAYNMGPFGIIVREKQVGGKATFWDLSQAGLLPEETAGYVPAIEGFALVLENLRSLRLGGAGKHPQTTAEITVKPGTRLSLIARAAHTSTLHIRELNRAYLRDTVPEGETTAWVPESEAHRAQIFFDSPGPDDRVDTCVPEDFDWGTTVLETSKYAQQCAPKP